MYDKNKRKYIKKKNVYYRPWGRYINFFRGKEFLIKELYVKPKGILSLQKHNFRSEHWLMSNGASKITFNRKKFIIKKNQYLFIPSKTIHRIENISKHSLIIVVAQVGKYLSENDIIRYRDKYGRI